MGQSLQSPKFKVHIFEGSFDSPESSVQKANENQLKCSFFVTMKYKTHSSYNLVE